MVATGTEDYTTVYNYNDANGKYTTLLQKEEKTVESDEKLLTLASNAKQTVYTYDDNGNQITKTADGKTETSTYDGLNQLVGVESEDVTASYTYNISGLRTSKTVDGETTRHIWQGQQIVADVTVGGNHLAKLYTRGTNLAATYDFYNGQKTLVGYYHQNAHGDVVNLTGADSKIIKTYKYDAFGVEKNIFENDTNPFRYCGEYFDTETSTIYLRARHYNPSSGRFTQRDSYAGRNEDPLSLNRYTYCYNSPIRLIDPTGLDSYIFYLKEWEDEAKDNKKTLNSIYSTDTHLIEVGSTEDITNAWNDIGVEDGKNVGIDTVIINTHANASILDFGEAENPSMTTSDIEKLDYKFMDQLILFGCNAGHLDHALSNPAAAFSRIVGAPVLASDGTVYAGKGKISLFKDSILNFITYKAWKYTPMADEHFEDNLRLDGDEKSILRDNKGWVIYRNSQLPETGKFSMTTNLKEMVSVMNKKRFRTD